MLVQHCHLLLLLRSLCKRRTDSFKCEICDHESPSSHVVKVHIGHIHKGLKKPGVFVEDESSDPVIVDTVGNNESELGDTSALNLNTTKRLKKKP